MKPAMQSEFPEGEGSCLAACVATILGLEPADVPNFMDGADGDPSTWFAALSSFVHERGFAALMLPETFELREFVARNMLPNIAGGIIEEINLIHTMVHVGVAPYHNPRDDGRSIPDPPESRILLVALKPGLQMIRGTDIASNGDGH